MIFVLFYFSYSSYISFYFIPHVSVSFKLNDDGRFFLFHLNLLYATFDFHSDEPFQWFYYLDLVLAIHLDNLSFLERLWL